MIQETNEAQVEIEPREQPRSRGQRLLWWAMVSLTAILAGIMAAGAVLKFTLDRQPEPLPVFSKIESFSLTERTGEPLSLEDLSGKIWVANFIYTTCPTVCPKLTTKMREVQGLVAGLETELGVEDAKVRLVSFTVDPENDTPEVLARYAEQYGADSRLWLFLTGSLDSVSEAVIDGMKIPFEKRGPSAAIEIMHGEKFVLVDQHGQIRAYFDADQEGMERLRRSLETLLRARDS